MLTFFPPPWQSASLENNRIARILALLNEKFRTPLNRSFQSQLKEFSLTFNHLHVSILSLFQNIVFHLVALFTFLTSSFSSFYILLKYSVYLVCVKLKFYFTNPTLYSSSWIFSADIFLKLKMPVHPWRLRFNSSTKFRGSRLQSEGKENNRESVMGRHTFFVLNTLNQKCA